MGTNQVNMSQYLHHTISAILNINSTSNAQFQYQTIILPHYLQKTLQQKILIKLSIQGLLNTLNHLWIQMDMSLITWLILV